MHSTLLDTSFTLYHTTISSATYSKLFQNRLINSSLPSNDRLKTYADRLTTYLAQHTPQYTDDLDDEREKYGVLKECRWRWIRVDANIDADDDTDSSNAESEAEPNTRPSIHRRQPPTPGQQDDQVSISVQLVYQNATFTFVLVSAYSALIKASPQHTRRVLDYMTEIFGVTMNVLKLADPTLQHILARYIDGLTQAQPFNSLSSTQQQQTGRRNGRLERSQGNSEGDVDEDELNRLAILKAAVGNLKLTVSVILPHNNNNNTSLPGMLRSMDLDIPYETLHTLLNKPPLTSTKSSPSFFSHGISFLQALSHHILEHTGLKLPLDATLLLPPQQQQYQVASSTVANSTATRTVNANGQTSETAAGPLRLSKLSTSLFAISTEGKIKFSRRAMDSAPTGYEDLIARVGVGVLKGVDREVAREGVIE